MVSDVRLMAEEREYFDSRLKTWLKRKDYAGKWALVKDKRLHGVYGEFDEAMRAGFKKFGEELFLVSQICPEEGSTATTLMLDEILGGCNDGRWETQIRK